MMCSSTVFVCRPIIDEMLQGRLTSQRAYTGPDFIAAVATAANAAERRRGAFRQLLNTPHAARTITDVRRRPRVAKGRRPVQREGARVQGNRIWNVLDISAAC